MTLGADERNVLRCLIAFHLADNRSPMFGELQSLSGIRSDFRFNRAMRSLERSGYIQWEPRKPIGLLRGEDGQELQLEISGVA